MSVLQSARMDKTKLSVAYLSEPSDETAYWQTQSPQARLQALELMRLALYGYDPSTARLQRLLTIARRP